MDTKKLLRFASFVPILALNLNITLWDIQSQIPVLAPNFIIEEEMAMTITLKERAEAIDRYFGERGMPLVGHGMKMIEEAEKHDLDWRLLPAIAVQESGGGKHAIWRCKNNPFGWASCDVKFESTEKAIEVVALNLAGGNPKTEKYYKNKDSKEKLYYYNGTVVPKYPQVVLSIMEAIDKI
ncbi:MAG: glucosaminidase domain-containing protein [Patescibacteria group bacterium]